MPCGRLVRSAWPSAMTCARGQRFVVVAAISTPKSRSPIHGRSRLGRALAPLAHRRRNRCGPDPV